MKDSEKETSEAIEATAAAWLAQQDDGFSPADEAEFRRWCAADPRHQAATDRLRRTWETLQQLRDFRPQAASHPDRDLLSPRPARRRANLFPALGFGLVAAALAWGVWVSLPQTRASGTHYVTTANGYQRLTLEDGSILELNAASEVQVEFQKDLRRVELLKGEAHFSVAKNPARPFHVEAGGVAVRAIGTAFDVRVDENHVAVLVTEGKVSVGDVKQPEAPAVIPLLIANERALISAKGSAVARSRVEKLAPDTVRQELAWQGPRFVFVETPLTEVVEQFNRRNQIQMVVMDPQVGAILIGGSFRPENLDAFVRLLATENDVVVTRPTLERIELRKAK